MKFAAIPVFLTILTCGCVSRDFSESAVRDVDAALRHPGCARGEPVTMHLEKGGVLPAVPPDVEVQEGEVVAASSSQNVRFDFCVDGAANPVWGVLIRMIVVSGRQGGEAGPLQWHSVNVGPGVEAVDLDKALFFEVTPQFRLWKPVIPGMNQGALLRGGAQGEQIFVSDQAVFRDGKYRSRRWVAGRLELGDLDFGVQRCRVSERPEESRWSVGTAQISASTCITTAVGEGTWAARALEVVVEDSSLELPPQLRGRRVFSGEMAERIYAEGAGHHGCHPTARVLLPEVAYMRVLDSLRRELHLVWQYGNAPAQAQIVPDQPPWGGAACDGFVLPPLRP